MGHEGGRERWAMFHENEVAVKESGRMGGREGDYRFLFKKGE